MRTIAHEDSGRFQLIAHLRGARAQSHEHEITGAVVKRNLELCQRRGHKIARGENLLDITGDVFAIIHSNASGERGQYVYAVGGLSFVHEAEISRVGEKTAEPHA